MKKIIIGFVAIEHLFFLIVEMFLWNTSLGQTIFKLTPEFAMSTKVLAANQGLYNGFLVGGLVWSLIERNDQFQRKLSIYFLSCVVIAGVFGAYSVGFKIFFIQACPALIGLGFVLIPIKINH